MASQSLRALYERLAASVSAGQWWPAQTRYEILLGAVLTQNTAWKNVEVALANLRHAGALQPEAIAALEPEALGEMIRPSGYWRVKTRYLQAITAWFVENDVEAPRFSDAQLRASLLQVRGVGEETADDIMLYAYDRPVFIYDTYARRALADAGLGEFRTYREAKRALDAEVANAEFTVAELAHCHGLIVEAGKQRASS